MPKELIQPILFLVAFSVWEFMRMGIKRFFARTVDTEYLTVADFREYKRTAKATCKECRTECKAGQATDQEDLVEAFNAFKDKVTEEMRMLRQITVRHLLTNGEMTAEDRAMLEGLLR